MKIEISKIESAVTVISLVGRFNMLNAQSFRDQVNAIILNGGNRIVVDLSAVTIFDSSALGAIIGGLKTVRQAGGDLRLASPTEQVKLVLELTNMNRVLVSYNSPEEAFKSE